MCPFSARHVRDFPESSTCGENVSVLVVTFPSGLVWNNEDNRPIRQKNSRLPYAQNVLNDTVAYIFNTCDWIDFRIAGP
jgi:hypothetical protein